MSQVSISLVSVSGSQITMCYFERTDVWANSQEDVWATFQEHTFLRPSSQDCGYWPWVGKAA